MALWVETMPESRHCVLAALEISEEDLEQLYARETREKERVLTKVR